MYVCIYVCITSFGLILFTNLICIGWFGTSLCTSTFLFLSTVFRENLATSEVCGMLLSWKPDFKPKLVCDFPSDLYPILDMNYEEAVSTVWLALFDVPTYVLYSYTIIMPKTTLPVDPCSFSCSGSLFPVNTLKGRFNSGHWLFVLTIYLMEIPCDGSTFFFRFPNRLSSVS